MVFKYVRKKGIKQARDQFKKNKLKEERAKLGYQLPIKLFGVNLYWKPRKLAKQVLIGFAGLTLAMGSLYYYNDRRDERGWEDRITPHSELQQIRPDFYKITASQWGIPELRLMCVYKMNTGGLLIHGALSINDQERIKLESLGKPEIISKKKKIIFFNIFFF